jgi:hypothetical protein
MSATVHNYNRHGLLGQLRRVTSIADLSHGRRAVLFFPNFERMLWLEFPGCREICCASETYHFLPPGHRLKDRDGGCKTPAMA